jgi:hypothetical protein
VRIGVAGHSDGVRDGVAGHDANDPIPPKLRSNADWSGSGRRLGVAPPPWLGVYVGGALRLPTVPPAMRK